MPRDETTARRTFLVLVLVGLALLAMVLQPFAYALLMAGILAGALSPLYEGLAVQVDLELNSGRQR